MDLQCKEVFLDDVVRVDVYKASEVTFDLPVNLSGIDRMVAPLLPEPQLVLSYTGDALCDVRDKSIKVKQTQKASGRSLIYTYNIEAVIEGGISYAIERVRSMVMDDHYIVATKADGVCYLLYGLPNTFVAEQNNDIKALSLKLSVSSLNGFVELMKQ